MLPPSVQSQRLQMVKTFLGSGIPLTRAIFFRDFFRELGARVSRDALRLRLGTLPEFVSPRHEESTHRRTDRLPCLLVDCTPGRLEARR